MTKHLWMLSHTAHQQMEPALLYDWLHDHHWPIVGIILDPGKKQVTDAQDRVQCR